MATSVIVTGVTGTAGFWALKKALADPSIRRVTALARRPLEINHPKLEVVIHQDFADYTPIRDKLRGHDACLWCLGISTTMVKSDEEYFRITHTFAIEACKAMNEENPGGAFTFCFLSGQGAESSEKSRFLFGRVKGKTENDLQKLGLGKVYSFRPGMIDPKDSPSTKSLHQRILTPILMPVFRSFIPSLIVTPEDLAKAMIKVARLGSDQVIFEHKEIKEMAASFDI